MLFNTAQYLIFLPLVVLIYYLLPAKVRHVWLLAASYYFYMQWNALYALLLLFSTVTTYACGLAIEKIREKEATLSGTGKTINWKKICLIGCIFLNLGILFFYKYLYFSLACVNQLLMIAGLPAISLKIDILLPVGISFYTLQSLGYLIDVYRNDIRAEKNLFMYALFVSFFPQLVAGPIERSKNLLTQLKQEHRLEYDNLRKGFYFVLYGLFLKMAIADHAAIIVDTVYNNPAQYPGFYIIFATVLFSIQVYCDFYGYSVIARGSAYMLGIQLMSNFEAPYYAKSVKEFWQRWHISLSSWFRDYLYIPMGGNRKGTLKKERNLLTVFTISGLWHGSSMGYIVWGALNGLYQIFGDAFHGIKKKLTGGEKRPPQSKIGKFFQTLLQSVCTLSLIEFSMIFFRGGGWNTSLTVLKNILCPANRFLVLKSFLMNLGTNRTEMLILILSILLLAVVDYMKYRGKDVITIFLKQNGCIRYLVFLILFFGIILFGCYGEAYDAQQFIYFQF